MCGPRWYKRQSASEHSQIGQSANELDEIAPITTNESEAELTPAVPREKKPRVWPVFAVLVLGLLAAAVLQALAVVGLVLLESARGGDVQEFVKNLQANLATPGMFILLAACGQVAFASSAIIAGWLSPVPFKERLGLLPPRQSWTVATLAMIGSLIPLAISFVLAYALTLVLPADPSVEKLFENMKLADAVPFVLFIALPPGIFEELLYRGYIQRRLLQRWRPGWAILVTSTLFALAHVQPHAMVVSFVLGLWLGFVAWRSGSVFPGMMCHAFVNGLVNAWRMVVKFGEIPETLQTVVEVGCLFVGLICFVLALRYLISDSDATSQPVS
jgi:membrane protease YdiL (CAAX protease family)